MAATSEDVARVAGVSRPAVSQILNGRGRFSPETIQRVTAAAASLHYRPSVAARTLATGRSDVVVALAPNTTYGPNLQDLIELLTREFAEVGLTLVLRFSTSPPTLFREFINAVQPRAVIAPLGPSTADERAAIDALRVPLVELHDTDQHDDLNYRIGELQGEYLLSRGYEHFAYAHLHDERRDVFGDARERGFTDVLHAAGRDTEASVQLALRREEAVAALRQLPGGTAVACYNDDVAIALLAAARELGRPVPGDVALLGMDSTLIGRLMTPVITSIAADPDAFITQFIPALVQRVMDPTSTAEFKWAHAPLHIVPGQSA